MTYERERGSGRRLVDSMPLATGRGAQDEITREALDRIFGAPAPVLDSMQAAMGREFQVVAAHDVIRADLDVRNPPARRVGSNTLA